MSRDRGSAALAGAALAFLLGCVLLLAAGPLLTDDLWWHLKMGEVYAGEGPWPDGDPLLHTAHDDAPIQHEWLFGVTTHAVNRTFGFHGLRVAHALAVVGIVLLAGSLFRREGRSATAAAFGAAFFIVLAWWRLFQHRPDLVSIPATFAVYWLLLEDDRPPSYARVGAFALLLLVWANMHSLFAIGPLLVLAALAGLALREVLRRRIPPLERPAHGAARARRLGAALALGLAASLANPRGLGQHLTFFTSSRQSGIWRVHDEWTPFDPFSSAYTTAAVSRLAWIATDLLLAAFVLAAGASLWRFLRRPSEERLRACDPALLAVGGASCVALLTSIRFLWMGVFPLLFVMRAARLAWPEAWQRWLPKALAAASLALAAGFLPLTAFPQVRALLPRAPRDYVATPYVKTKYHVAGVRFLRDAGLEGNLFNKYPAGGFLGYWLAPRLRTFVDSRTEHYPAEILDEYSAVNTLRGTRERETFVDILERRQVDLFFGTGPPTGIWRDAVLYTAEHLRDVPGWILVSRSVHHAIYLRTNERNRENLRRVVDYYARQGVPFDPVRGLDAGALLRERPDWAIAHDAAPPDFHALQEAWVHGDFAAADALGRLYALLGEYETQLEIDRAASALDPEAKAPRRRSVYGLLRLGRRREALAEARVLVRMDRQDPRSQAVLGIASRCAALRGMKPGDPRMQALLSRFPLVEPWEEALLAERFHRVVLR